MLKSNIQRVTNLAGEIPISNLDGGEQVIDNYITSNIAICSTNRLTNISHGIHSHNSYEFVICHVDIPSIVIDKKVIDRSNSTLFAINPMQEHGMALGMKGFSLTGIHVDKAFVQEISEEIYGSPHICFSNESFAVSHEINTLLSLFLEEIKYDRLGQRFAIENLSLLLVGNLIRQLKHNFPSRPHNIPEAKINNMQKVIDYINSNFNAGISCVEMSKLAKMDRFSFIRSFKAQTGKTPYEYLLDLKINKAKKMLKAGRHSITEISMICNFSSHSHFTSTFKRKTGISPSDYRKLS